MPRLCSVLLAVTFAFFTFAAPATAQGDLDCYQFGSWNDAQATYDEIMYYDGWDWMWLDEDGDGLPASACTTGTSAGRLGAEPLSPWGCPKW
jgi:hypothetical protein